MESFSARSSSDIRLTYRAVGSSFGQAEFSQVIQEDYSSGLTDFGAGDIPMTQSIYDNLQAASRDMVHVPFCLGAIGIFHSVPSSEAGGALKLSPCVLAKIFDGAITAWDHAEIIADNPNLNVPAGTKIQVGHRTTGSSSTGGTTGYLQAKCPGSWTRGSGSTIDWPTLANFNEVEGSPGMVTHIADTPYAIGYLDAGHGHQRGFGEVSLLNEAGTWLTSAEALAAGGSMTNNGIATAGSEAMAAGNVIPTSATASWANVNLYGKAGTNTWPIVLVSYIYLNENWSAMSADKAGLLKAFVDYVTGEGQDMLPEFSFNPLPVAMNKWSDVWENDIVKPTAGVTPFTFEESKNKWTGMGEHVISVKRNSYSMWKINELSLQMADTLARLQALEEQAGISSSSSSSSSLGAPSAGQQEGSTQDDTLAIAALVIAIVAIVVNCCGFLVLSRKLSKGDRFAEPSGDMIGRPVGNM
jgi:ABC-type phosphate transport system substrate-binding protein